MKKIVFAIATLILIFSCSKKNGSNNPPQKSCRIDKVKITSGVSITNYNFSYDQNKRIILIETSDNSGHAGKIVISYPTAGPLHMETFTANNPTWFNWRDVSTYGDGTINHVTAVNNVPNASPVTEDYAHDTHGYLFSRTNRYKTEMKTTIYKWDNFGNLNLIYDVDNVTVQPISDSSFFDYYLDKTYDPPNVDLYSKSMSHAYAGLGYITTFGVPLVYTKNLLKKEYSRFGSRTFTYEFDADGKMVKINSVSDVGGKAVIDFEYACD